MKKLIFIFILTLGTISCSSDDEAQDEVQIVISELTGKWNWVSSCGGFTGDCWFPSDDNFESIEFKNDLSYIEKINGIIVTETNYLVPEMIIENVYKIEFHNGYSTYFRFVDDNLSIQGGDFWSEYKRINE